MALSSTTFGPGPLLARPGQRPVSDICPPLWADPRPLSVACPLFIVPAVSLVPTLLQDFSLHSCSFTTFHDPPAETTPTLSSHVLLPTYFHLYSQILLKREQMFSYLDFTRRCSPRRSISGGGTPTIISFRRLQNLKEKKINENSFTNYFTDTPREHEFEHGENLRMTWGSPST